MQSVLEKMLSQLSAEDQHTFNELAKRLQAVNGDIKQLSPEDLALIQIMERKYDSNISQSVAVEDESNEQINLLLSPFALHVRQILARDLGQKYPLEDDAIGFAFENKWLPLDCRDDELANDLFAKFEEDITQINLWRNALVDVYEDKKMAVGLAWFMVIFQLHQNLN